MTKRRYESDELVVTWDSEKCIHSGHCAQSLPKTFRPRERPWIEVSESADADIAHTIDGCPSRALGYEWLETKEQQSPASAP